MEIAISFAFGVVLGVGIVFVITWLRQKQEIEVTITRVKDSFADLSLSALSRNTEEFLRLANERFVSQSSLVEKGLDNKKELIDQTFYSMKQELESLRTVVTNLEKERSEKYGELSQQLRETAEQTGKLQETTSKLQNALAGSNVRGQWGEKMAEDVLRIFGFIEGVNYQKQKMLTSSNTRPDYTFLLPHGLKVNMDVKFPLANYWKYCDCVSENDRQQYKVQFLKDVRSRLKEVTTREYINPEESTLDCVIMFIPNEQVYGFVSEQDRSVFFDEALHSKVIVCSPLTLYAILAIIRQAVDNFTLEKTAAEMLSILGGFYKQWTLYIKSFDRLDKAIGEVQKEFSALTRTRQNQLERQIRKIENLREHQGISITLPDGVELSE